MTVYSPKPYNDAMTIAKFSPKRAKRQSWFIRICLWLEIAVVEA